MSVATRKPRNPDGNPPAETVVPDGLGEFVDPSADPVLNRYLVQVIAWHSFIRVLLLPQENPDIKMSELYVEPCLSHRWLPPDSTEPQQPSADPALEVLARHPRLVVLGDPGSGKSTLISWIAYQLALRKETPWAARLDAGHGRLIPVPFVLRELSVGPHATWDTLVASLLEHPMVRDTPELADRLPDLFQRGQAMIMLDGLDEIGSIAIRTALRAAVKEGMERYPACRWLLTSRVVGYDAVPFHETETPDDLAEHSAALRKAYSHSLCGEGVEVRYVAPFNDAQVQQFCRNWYHLRDPSTVRADGDAQRFHDRIRAHHSTARLARTPHLLTMMAVIYRAKAQLPHGRALLYNEITEAYLEALDALRGLEGSTQYPFEQKKRWLARVGFEMQRRRAASGDDTTPRGEVREILVSAPEVEDWVGLAMEESGYERRDAGAFLDFVKRRSGLLLPRGVGPEGIEQYAFLHLSFQEYFAAVHLEKQLLSPGWMRGRAPEGTRAEDLHAYARTEVWRETLIFLFELLAPQTGWPEELAAVLFGDNFRDIAADDDSAETSRAAMLLAHVTADPHSGLPRSLRDRAVEVCCAWEIADQQRFKILEHQWPYLLPVLFEDPDRQATVWTVLSELAKKLRPERLYLEGLPIDDISSLVGVPSIKYLSLPGTDLADLQPLANMPNLRGLSIQGTPATDLTPLAHLTALQELALINTQVNNLSRFAGLAALQTLVLINTVVSDLTPLTGLRALRRVCLLGSTPVSEGEIKRFQAARKAAGLDPVAIIR